MHFNFRLQNSHRIFFVFKIYRLIITELKSGPFFILREFYQVSNQQYSSTWPTPILKDFFSLGTKCSLWDLPSWDLFTCRRQASKEEEYYSSKRVPQFLEQKSILVSWKDLYIWKIFSTQKRERGILLLH